jgi:sensor domain CHASE-containing protein
MTVVRYEYGAPEAPSPRKTRRKTHMRALLVLAVMIAALAGAIAFVVLVRIG